LTLGASFGAVAAALSPFMVRPFLRRRGHLLSGKSSDGKAADRLQTVVAAVIPKRGWFGPSGRQVSQAALPSLPPGRCK